nr:hypothetical protein [uncultured Oscillibacter sp.]
MVFSYCKCSYHLAGNENAAANFYNTHFVPDGWELVYSKLSECRSIHLKGRCKDCYGDLNEMIPLPEGLSGDALFQAIYDAMWSAHPYDAILEHIGCHGPCEERSAFYRRRDRIFLQPGAVLYGDPPYQRTDTGADCGKSVKRTSIIAASDIAL